MRTILHQITSVSMALLVLLSTMSFTVDMHYCGDHLVDFSLSKTVDGCAMKAQKPTPSTSCSLMEMEMDCCTNVEIVLEGQDDLKTSFEQPIFEQQLFLAALLYGDTDLFDPVYENSVPFKEYAPPPLIRNVQILDQTFLI